jgi:hypothetical protein
MTSTAIHTQWAAPGDDINAVIAESIGADLWLDPNESVYQVMLTIKGNWMFANAGIDESNSG